MGRGCYDGFEFVFAAAIRSFAAAIRSTQALLAEKLRSLEFGTDYGPLVHATARSEVARQVQPSAPLHFLDLLLCTGSLC